MSENPTPPHVQCECWRIRLPRSEIAYVRNVVEAYDGLAQVTSDPGRDEMLWIVPCGQLSAARALLDALAHELSDSLPKVERLEDSPTVASSRSPKIT